ncbi:unnamed protein product [Cylicocyclus nassatus]|uniref:Uncharacterized protein n=1 Tax=Cylicocyclus nassatus TaxID=53992 RepID=A0AA36M3W1_CYLNA|nr:unnamed protein product [Cylicocyclus nassatus]
MPDCGARRCKAGRRQEFSTCNLTACPIDKHCVELLAQNKLCDGRACIKPEAALAGCREPQCCPPFINVNGTCQSDEEHFNDFVSKK